MNIQGNRFLKDLNDLLETYNIELHGTIYVYCTKDINLQGNLEFNTDSIEITYDQETIAELKIQDEIER